MLTIAATAGRGRASLHHGWAVGLGNGRQGALRDLDVLGHAVLRRIFSFRSQNMSM